MANIVDCIDRDEFMRLVQEAYQAAAEKAGVYCRDIVLVVRCKDCAHASERDFRPHGGKKVQKCKMAMGDIYNDNDFFCAWGERRENGHNDG